MPAGRRWEVSVILSASCVAEWTGLFGNVAMFLFHSVLRKIMTTDKRNGTCEHTFFLLESWACDWRECWNDIAVYEIQLLLRP